MSELASDGKHCASANTDSERQRGGRVSAPADTEACQPNMRSRAYAKGGILVPLEQEIIGRWYYDWYRASMNLGESP